MPKPKDPRAHRKTPCVICHVLDHPTNMTPVHDYRGGVSFAHPHHHGVDTVRVDPLAT